MKLIIDIPEAIIKDAKDSPNYYPSYLFEKIWKAVSNGTVLPKGHGRLGDLDALDNDLREQQKSYEHTFGIRQPINEAIRDGIIMARCHIDHAPIIIEADKGE